jgi:hypothetical protein
LPDEEALTINFEVPEPVMLEGFKIAVSPEPGETLVERRTVSEKPFTPVTLTVMLLSVVPIVTGPRLEPLTDRVKSLRFTVTVRVAEWAFPPSIPVTTTEYVPRAEDVNDIVIETMLLTVKMTEGLRVVVSPELGKIVVERDTEPEKPPRLSTVTVDEAVAPVAKETLSGLTERLKSGRGESVTVTYTRTVWDNGPLDPVMLIL